MTDTARPLVAIDARTLQDRPMTGVGRLVANILPHLAGVADLELLTDARRPPPPNTIRGRIHALKAPSRRASVWLETAAPRFLRGHHGIFHGTYYGLPRVQPVPMVVTIHDLSFEHHPEWFTRAQAFAYRAQARHASRTARVILTTTQAVSREIQELYGIAPNRILVTGDGVDPVFLAAQPADRVAAVHRRYGLTDDAYVVALGGRVRRHLDVAIEAWRRATLGEVRLVVVGGDEPVPADVLQLGRLDDADWSVVLGGATVLLYPTSYEGYGLPAAEAMAVGVPVVAARVASLPEVLGDAAAWADALSAEAFADALRRVLDDAELHGRLREAGLARSARICRWDAVAAVHEDAYLRAMS